MSLGSDPPGLEAWTPWHPNEVAERLQGISAPWYFAGGWALDLWHGLETRSHEDVEIAVLRSDFPLYQRALRDMQFFCAGGSHVWLLKEGTFPPDSVHQVWCLGMETRRWKLDIMLEPGTADEWVFRRDDRIRRRRTDMVGKTSDGLPFLKPAGVLMFKAKHRRPKDELDFENAVENLDCVERDWLRNALARAHPGHEWIARL